jgi:hypothetical protein
MQFPFLDKHRGTDLYSATKTQPDRRLQTIWDWWLFNKIRYNMDPGLLNLIATHWCSAVHDEDTNVALYTKYEQTIATLCHCDYNMDQSYITSNTIDNSTFILSLTKKRYTNLVKLLTRTYNYYNNYKTNLQILFGMLDFVLFLLDSVDINDIWSN